MNRSVGPTAVALLVLVVSGCAGDRRAPSRVFDTPGGSVLVYHRLPLSGDLHDVRAGGRLRMIGGRFGCLGFVRGIEDVVVLFPPGSRVHQDEDGPPTVSSGGHRYGVGDLVHGQPWNARPQRLSRVSLFDRDVPSNCRNFAAQAFVSVTPG